MIDLAQVRFGWKDEDIVVVSKTKRLGSVGSWTSPFSFARPFDHQKKLDAHISTYREKMRSLAEQMRTGQISLKDWVYQSRLAVSGYIMDGTVLGLAKAKGLPPSKLKLSSNDRREVMRSVEEQLRYFNKFAKTVGVLTLEGTPLTAQVDQRAEMYGGAIRAAYNQAALAQDSKAGDPTPLRWVRHATDSCETCIANDGQIETADGWRSRDVWPAHNTICRSNCKCTLSPVGT